LRLSLLRLLAAGGDPEHAVEVTGGGEGGEGKTRRGALKLLTYWVSEVTAPDQKNTHS
jgi:hypothetical protein